MYPSNKTYNPGNLSQYTNEKKLSLKKNVVFVHSFLKQNKQNKFW